MSLEFAIIHPTVSSWKFEEPSIAMQVNQIGASVDLHQVNGASLQEKTWETYPKPFLMNMFLYLKSDCKEKENNCWTKNWKMIVTTFLISFGLLKVWVSSKFHETLTFESLSFIKVSSNFDFWKSEFHQSFIKLWFLKVWVLSKFYFWKSEFCRSLTFESLTFVKLWLLKVWLLSNIDDFDKTRTFCIKLWQKSDFQSQTLTKLRLPKVKLWQKSDFQKSNFDKTQTLKVWVLSNFDETQTFKVWVLSNFDETQTFKNESFMKLWWKSGFQKSKTDQNVVNVRWAHKKKATRQALWTHRNWNRPWWESWKVKNPAFHFLRSRADSICSPIEVAAFKHEVAVCRLCLIVRSFCLQQTRMGNSIRFSFIFESGLISFLFSACSLV